MNLTEHRVFRGKREQKGMALVISIMLLALLTVIAIGFMTLSISATRLTSTDSAGSIARANARLALMLAIGNLQKSVGPDQRVSATASIFDTDPDTPEIDGVNLPHALGAWSTVLANGDPIIYQADDGYHADRRNPSDPGTIDHRDNVFSWLISGSEDPAFDPRTSPATVGSGATVLGYDNGEEVIAPLVAVEGKTASGDGAYASTLPISECSRPLCNTTKM